MTYTFTFDFCWFQLLGEKNNDTNVAASGTRYSTKYFIYILILNIVFSAKTHLLLFNSFELYIVTGGWGRISGNITDWRKIKHRKKQALTYKNKCRNEETDKKISADQQTDVQTNMYSVKQTDQAKPTSLFFIFVLMTGTQKKKFEYSTENKNNKTKRFLTDCFCFHSLY